MDRNITSASGLSNGAPAFVIAGDWCSLVALMILLMDMGRLVIYVPMMWKYEDIQIYVPWNTVNTRRPRDTTFVSREALWC